MLILFQVLNSTFFFAAYITVQSDFHKCPVINALVFSAQMQYFKYCIEKNTVCLSYVKLYLCICVHKYCFLYLKLLMEKEADGISGDSVFVLITCGVTWLVFRRLPTSFQK